ncbi:MAG: Arm DNA-binding domain-containing protein [Janthinobacterium lividum]
MGRRSVSGIEIRDTSIRIRFTHLSKQVSETLYLNNEPMLPTPANVKYATRMAVEVKDRIRTGTFDYAEYFPHSPRAEPPRAIDAVMLYDTMDRWLKLHEIKASTKSQYEARIENFWKVKMADRPIDQVKYSDILEALASGTWKSGKTRNNELSMIKQMFEFARKDKIIAFNPCDEVERSSYQKKGPDPFTMKEVTLILDALKADRPAQMWNYVQFMFFTGLRTSEGIALRWEHVDFQRNEVLVEMANVYDEETDTTKTATARKVKLNSQALAALVRQKDHTFLGDKEIFHDPKTDQPWAYRTITDTRSFWDITLKRLGMRRRRPYNTRHTYATIGLMSGARPGFLAKQLGHSTQVFYQVYAQWVEGDDDDREMSKIEEALTGFSPGLALKQKTEP